eukprot:c23883_g2_i1 orf=367-4050(+)
MNSKLHTEDHTKSQEQPLHQSFHPNMPTLRVELLKSREEDEDKNIIVEKRVVHSNRVSLVAQHAPELKYNFTELKQGKEKVGTGAVPSVAKKLSANVTKGSLITSYTGQTPQSPSESDSFSIESSSSSCKSEADSIRKPSPPAPLLKPNPPSLHMSLGSYLGAQAVEMWDVTQMSPCDLSKAIREKLNGAKVSQDGFLEFNFSQGKMVDSRLRRKENDKASSCANAEHLRGEYVLKPESANIEVLDEEWAHGLATPAFYSAAARSPETSLETSRVSGDTSSAPFIGQEPIQTQSIKELMDHHKVSHNEAGSLHADEHKQCHMEAHDRTFEYVCDNAARISQVTNKDPDSGSAPFEADISIDRVVIKTDHQAEINFNTSQLEKKSSYSRALSCHFSQSKQEEGFSFQAPLSKGTYMQDMTRTSVDRSTYPEVVSDQSKPASAKGSLETYIFSTPLMGRSASSTQSHTEKGTTTKSFLSLGSRGHAYDGNNKLTKAEAGALTPPPVHEIKFKANANEYTPISPLSLSEAGNYERCDEYNGKEYIDMAWYAASKTQPPVHSLSKAHWDWRSKSLGARVSLKSAVRNLEAAFGGPRSVSLPKTRSQTHQREKKSEGAKFIDRVFLSPAKGRHKRAEEVLKPIERPAYSGDHIIQDSVRSGIPRTRELRSDDSGRHCVSSTPPLFRPLPVSKHHQKSEIPEYRVSSLPPSRSVHCLAPLKGLSGHTSPLFSMPLGSAQSQPIHTTSCMLQGYLQCIVRDGLVCYTLSLKDSEEMLLAKACAFGHDARNEGCKWMYTFHSGRSKGRGKGTNGWRSWLKKDNKSTADLAGKMQVSSRLCSEVSPTGKRTQSLVSEFILYDERSDDAVRSQSLRFLSSNNGCHSTTSTPAESPSPARSAYEFVRPSVSARKQVPDIPRSPSSARISLKSVSTNQPQPYSPLKATASHQSSYSIDVWSDSDVTEPEVRRLGSYPSLHSELAAIVIKMPTDDHETDSHQSSNGACRSLKFSDEQSKGSQGDIQERNGQGTKSVSVMLPETKHGQPDGVCLPTSECVTMMLPKEHHGLPKGGVQGPTSLIERWKCGGKCDCGGWDLGCGMKILSTQRSGKLATTSNHGNSIQSISHNQPLSIYSQGKTREMLLNLSLVQEGYFILKFKNELSPLKAFAASVAILHSRESSLTDGRMHVAKTVQPCQSDSEKILDSISKDSDMPAFLEVCKDIPTWRPSNHPLSPFGRV